MVSSMKTTIDIADSLLDEAKRAAAREGTTLRALVEAALRSLLRERRAKAGSFTPRDVRVGGKGLRPELRGRGWDALRDLAYEGRGG